MTTRTNTPLSLKLAGLGLALAQVLDVIVHAATDQVEPIRIAANLIVLLWLALMVTGRMNAHGVLVGVAALVGYLGLNLVFLAREGLTNAAAGGGLRVMLFVFILVTVGLGSGLLYGRARIARP